MISILSSGYGRLHLAQSADWLCKSGVKVKFVYGGVPSKPNGCGLWICSKILKSNVYNRIRKRAICIGNGCELLTCSILGLLSELAYWCDGRFFKSRLHGVVSRFAWIIFGWNSRWYIRRFFISGQTVFHVRSGAGHGGAIKLAKKLGVPVVVDHSIAHPEYMEKHLRAEYEKNGAMFDLGTSSPFWRLVAEDCEWADALLVNSFFVRDTFIEQGYPAEKIKVVYLGTRPDFFGLRNVKATNRGERKLRLLFTGGFGFRKGAEYILDAVRILMDKSPVPFEMDVVGDYSGAKGLIEKHKDENLPIVFHGQVPQDDLKKFLVQSDIYVFPSLAEGCACSGMEAMAAGLCVIATHEAGLPIEDGVNGCVVLGKNAEAVAIKIMWLMEHPNEIDRMGLAAADLICTNYTWEQYAENVKEIYKELCQ